ERPAAAQSLQHREVAGVLWNAIRGVEQTALSAWHKRNPLWNLVRVFCSGRRDPGHLPAETDQIEHVCAVFVNLSRENRVLPEGRTESHTSQLFEDLTDSFGAGGQIGPVHVHPSAAEGRKLVIRAGFNLCADPGKGHAMNPLEIVAIAPLHHRRR